MGLLRAGLQTFAKKSICAQWVFLFDIFFICMSLKIISDPRFKGESDQTFALSSI